MIVKEKIPPKKERKQEGRLEGQKGRRTLCFIT
jgi:hypothetical protein